MVKLVARSKAETKKTAVEVREVVERVGEALKPVPGEVAEAFEKPFYGVAHEFRKNGPLSQISPTMDTLKMGMINAVGRAGLWHCRAGLWIVFHAIW